MENIDNLNDVPSKEIIHAAKPLEKLYNNKEVLNYIDSYFEYIRELNTNHMDYLNSLSNK